MKKLNYLLSKFTIILISVGLLTLFSSYTIQRIDFDKGRFNNVCKNLKGEALVYFVFVDSKETAPWTEFDIRSTLDSMRVAVDWINAEARKSGIPLTMRTDYYIGEEHSTVSKNLPEGTVYKSAMNPNLEKGTANLNYWADGIVKKVGGSLQMEEKDGIPDIKTPRNKERLVAYLRDKYNAESVALLFMVNNYFRNDISLALNTLGTEDVEFAIVSYKYPAEIAHSILSLYGAAPLYESTFRRDARKIAKAAEIFPNDIMQDTYATPLLSREVGALTQYLVGWSATLPKEYEPLLTDKIIRF